MEAALVRLPAAARSARSIVSRSICSIESESGRRSPGPAGEAPGVQQRAQILAGDDLGIAGRDRTGARDEVFQLAHISRENKPPAVRARNAIARFPAHIAGKTAGKVLCEDQDDPWDESAMRAHPG